MSSYISEKIQELREIQARRDQLYRELEDSYLIRSIWPSVYEHGEIRIINKKSGVVQLIRGDGLSKDILVKDLPGPLKAKWRTS